MGNFRSSSHHLQRGLHKNLIQNTEELINSIIYLILHVFYIRLFNVRRPENDLKKIKTCPSVSEV